MLTMNDYRGMELLATGLPFGYELETLSRMSGFSHPQLARQYDLLLSRAARPINLETYLPAPAQILAAGCSILLNLPPGMVLVLIHRKWRRVWASVALLHLGQIQLL